MDCSMPGLPVSHHILEFAQTHVHWVIDAIQPSHSLSSPSPPAFNLSWHQGLFQWVGSSHQVAKVLVLQLQYQSFQWIFMGKRAVVSGGQMLVTPQRDSHGELEMARERKMGAGLTPRRLQPGRSRTPPQRDEYPEQELCRWAAPQHRQWWGPGASQSTGREAGSHRPCWKGIEGQAKDENEHWQVHERVQRN